MPSCCQGALLHKFSEATVARMLDAIGPLESMPQICVQIRHIGGAMSKVAPEATPLGRARTAQYMTYAIGVPNPFASAAALSDHAEGMFAALGESILCRGPLNFIGEGSVRREAVRGVFGDEEYARLQRVKASVDPDNAFRYASMGLD